MPSKVRDIAKFGRNNKYKFKLIGIDANDAAIEYAKELSIDYPELSFETIDIFSEEFKNQTYDVVLCTLFLHHFKSKELISFLKPTVQKATIGAVVNDLHRHRLAYYLFKLIGLFIKNKMVREDGLTSVLRAFKRKELEERVYFTQDEQFFGKNKLGAASIKDDLENLNLNLNNEIIIMIIFIINSLK